MQRLHARHVVALVIAIGAILLGSPAHAGLVTLGSLQDVCIPSGITSNEYDWGTSNNNNDPYVMFNPGEATSADGLIQFDLSSIASGSTIESAFMSLYHEFNTQNGVAFDLYRVTQPWDEATVTYDTRPTVDPTILSSLTINDNSTGVRREWDVTSVVQGWVSGTYANDGLLIRRNPDEQPWPYFSSKEAAHSDYRPQLVVQVKGGGPQVPEPSALSLLASAGVAGTAVLLRRRSR